MLCGLSHRQVEAREIGDPASEEKGDPDTTADLSEVISARSMARFFKLDRSGGADLEEA